MSRRPESPRSLVSRARRPMTRLSSALNSDDLTHSEHACDVDVLQATGSVSINRNLGVLILEAREGCAGEGSHSVARIKDLQVAIEAVSYTHLRAHETGRNLVCRLLLE